MNSLATLLDHLQASDIQLWLEEGRVRVSAPPAAVTEEVRRALAQHKSELQILLEKQAMQPIPATPRTGDEPLTYAQQRLWFLQRLEANSAYNMPAVLQLQGALDVAVLQQALTTVVARHEALRTTFVEVEGEIYQRIAPATPVTLPVINLAASGAQSQVEAALALAADELRRPFALSQGPLLRVALLRVIAPLTTPATHYLVVNMHHIISDGVSIALLIDEISALYNAGVRGETRSLPPLPIQYADFARWQLRWRDGQWLAQQAAYWQAKLQGAPPLLELPTDRPRPAWQSFHGQTLKFTIDRATTAQIHHFSQQHKATPFMTLLSAFALLLHRYSHQDDLLIGTPIAGRTQPEVERLIGLFINTLVMRITMTDTLTGAELLAQVRQTALEAYEHQELPFERLLELLQLQRNHSYNPVFQVMFAMQPSDTEALQLSGLEVTPVKLETGMAKFDLTLMIGENAQGFQGELEYNSDLFDAATAHRMVTHFQQLLRALVTQPTAPVTTLALLTPAERQQLLVDWNQTAQPFDSTQSFPELFEAQVVRTPAAVAVRFGTTQLTYAELNNHANRIAHRLRALGIGVDHLVALLGDRNPAFLAAILGVFKAGGAYLPLDLRAPAARQAQILTQSRTPLLLASQDFAATVAALLSHLPAEQPLQVVWIEDLLAPGESTNLPLLTAATTPGERLAYVIYTSGSTGLPKGAMVEHRGMINHLYAKIQDLQLTAADTIAQNAPQSFDISVWQFLAALVIGGQTHIFDNTIASDPVRLLQESTHHGITILEVVPSLLRTMVEELAQGTAPALTTLRYLIPTGEALPPNLARQWLRACPHIPLVNAYGPTECSDDVTHYFVHTPPDAGVVNMPIGRPILNMRMYILDAHRQPVPIGVAGELYVGGVGVGRGYIHDPERTANAFVRDPFSADPHARLYKTGDKARYLADGTIEYLGRLDYQVKIRGFRIELGEIEAVLEAHPAVRQAVVMDRTDSQNSKYLVAYLTAEEGAGELDLHAIRQFLKQRLPEYMAPALLMPVATMPLTNNGKIDRKALPAPADEDWGGAVAYCAPETALHRRLVEIWADVLNLQPTTIGIHHSFFDLGGHSLLADRIIARVRTAFAVELPIRELMEQPTIAGLATCIQHYTPLTDLLSQPATEYAFTGEIHEVIEL